MPLRRPIFHESVGWAGVRSSPSRHGRDDGDLVAVGHRGGGAVEQADVVVVDVDVDEAVDLAARAAQLAAQTFVARLQAVEELAQSLPSTP